MSQTSKNMIQRYQGVPELDMNPVEIASVAMANEVQKLESEALISKILLDGSRERERILLSAKNYWVDKAKQLEQKLAKARELEQKLLRKIHERKS